MNSSLRGPGPLRQGATTCICSATISSNGGSGSDRTSATISSSTAISISSSSSSSLHPRLHLTSTQIAVLHGCKPAHTILHAQEHIHHTAVSVILVLHNVIECLQEQHKVDVIQLMSRQVLWHRHHLHQRAQLHGCHHTQRLAIGTDV